MSSLYEQELGFVKEAKDDLFPDFLFNPLFNDFDDNYYTRSFANDELASKIKKLRRRYSDFFDWLDAMDTYNDYMELLVEKYGSYRVIRNALKADLIMDPVPAKPKLKNTKRNRQYSRSGVIPSRQCQETPSQEEMLAIARQAFPDKMGQDVTEDSMDDKIPKDLKKRLRQLEDNLAASNRKRNMYRSVGNNSGTDFIVEYLNQAKRGVYDSHGKNNEDSNKSLWELVKEDERRSLMRPEILEDEEELNTTSIVNGRLVNRKDAMKLEIMKELAEEGIDVLGRFGKGMDKKAVKMIKSQIGYSEPASKKELKKIKKRARRERERIERRRDSNRLLEQTLLGNKVSFRSDDNSLSFRLKDVYKD